MKAFPFQPLEQACMSGARKLDVTCHVCRVRANDYRLINNQSNSFDRRAQFKAVPLHNSLFDEGCTDTGNRGLKTRKF